MPRAWRRSGGVGENYEEHLLDVGFEVAAEPNAIVCVRGLWWVVIYGLSLT